MAETGRWDAVDRVNLAWPWTVTAEGKGRYFDTKAAAVAEVRALKARRIRNIDVGCMQINLFYHPDAFADLEAALDPASNVAYAASYLKNLRLSQGSWTRAAGAYHSQNPTLGSAYRARVMRLWSRVRDIPTDIPTDVATDIPTDIPTDVATDTLTESGPQAENARIAGSNPSPAIDRVRTAQLNSRLESARAAARRADDAAAIRHRQLAAWRQDRVRSDQGNHLALMRRAHARMLRRQALKGMGDQKVAFADKRQRQLQSWRLGLKQPTF